MFIFNGQGTEIINSDYVQRFAIIQKDDAILIAAVLSSDLVTIGRYAEKKEAESAMYELMSALSTGESYFMPENTGRYLPEKKRHGYHGGKSTGHGGS